MKKLLLLVALLITGFSVNAQTIEQDALKLVSIVSESAFDSVIDQMATIVPEGKKADYTKEAKATLPSLYKSMSELYVEEFTHDEIKEILAFYETPVGKKMAEKAMTLSQKGMLLGQQWGMNLHSLAQKYQ